MGKFNKATAGTIGAAIGSVVAAVFPEWGVEVTGAITVLVTALFVGFAPANAA